MNHAQALVLRLSSTNPEHTNNTKRPDRLFDKKFRDSLALLPAWCTCFTEAAPDWCVGSENIHEER